MESTPLKLAYGNVKTDTYYSFGEPTRTNRNKFMTKVGAWIYNATKLAPLTRILYHTPSIPITVTAHNGFDNHLPPFPAAPVAHHLLHRVIITGAAPLLGGGIEPALPLTMLTINPPRHNQLC